MKNFQDRTYSVINYWLETREKHGNLSFHEFFPFGVGNNNFYMNNN